MHLFETVSGHTNDAGQEGRRVLMVGLHRLKRKQVDILTIQKGASTGGMASIPATSSKIIDKRIQARCSPKKNK